MDASGKRAVVNVPNSLTALRVLLVPLFGAMWLAGDARALWLLVPAALTDLLDGWLARRLGQCTTVGALLDPIADKLFVLVALLAGALRGVAPAWFVALVVGRDVVIAGAALTLYLTRRDSFGPRAWRPSLLGKAAQALLALVIVVIAINDLWLGYAPGALLPLGMAAGAALAWLAVLQYGLRAHEVLCEPRYEQDAVVRRALAARRCASAAAALAEPIDAA